MNVRLHPEAETEVSEAYAYFEREEEGLGIEFVRAGASGGSGNIAGWTGYDTRVAAPCVP